MREYNNPPRPNPWGNTLNKVHTVTSLYSVSVDASEKLFGGLWTDMRQMAERSPALRTHLQRVAESVASSTASSTMTVYRTWFRRFCAFCKKHKLGTEEANGAAVVLFLQELVSERRAASSISQAKSAIAWFFQTAGKADPTQHRLVSSIIAKAKRAAPPVTHKEPTTLEHLHWLQQYAQKKRTYAALRTYTLSLALFAAFSRSDELIDLTVGAVLDITDASVTIYVPKSKTDQLREGEYKYLPAAVHTTLCPVAAFRRWLKRREIGGKGTDALFPAWKDKSRPISITTFSENLKAALEGSGLPKITGHSHRAGAATKAISNRANIEDVQLLGAWRDPRTLQSYVRRSKERRLEAAKHLGL